MNLEPTIDDMNRLEERVKNLETRIALLERTLVNLKTEELSILLELVKMR